MQNETYDIRVYNKDGSMFMNYSVTNQKSLAVPTRELVNDTYFITCTDSHNMAFTAQVIIRTLTI